MPAAGAAPYAPELHEVQEGADVGRAVGHNVA